MIIRKNKNRLLDGILRRANLSYGFGNLLNRITGSLSYIQDEATEQTAFFREDYRNEVRSILRVFPQKGITNEEFLHVLKWNKPLTKRLMQHLYTSEKPELYDSLQKFVREFKTLSPKERSTLQDDVARYVQELIDDPRPQFGACHKCLESIKLNDVQAHKKTIQNADPKMWDLFSQ